MHIRNYHPDDKATLLLVFDLNCPQYFAPEERSDLQTYLDTESEDYFVVECDNKVVDCGGINIQKDKNKGVLSWDIIHPDYQKRGIGKALVAFRVERLKKTHLVEEIGVRTSQFTDQFYAKCGFELQEVVKDYWSPGYDLYDMKYIGII
jgi:N-acetylglutamate synthase-like GNAT family acetyltransferase